MIPCLAIRPEKALLRLAGPLAVLGCLLAAASGLVPPLLHAAPAPESAPASTPQANPVAAAIPVPAWHPLISRLAADGLYGTDVESALLALPAGPSSLPMGRKLKEIYTRQFITPPPPPPPPPGEKPPAKPRPRVYPGVITPDNVKLCRDFLALHKAAFDAAELRYRVPREIAVALLFVETRLGTYLGKESAFTTLASMAASTTPDHVADTLDALPDSGTRLDWVQNLLDKRSDWAYTELSALITDLRAAQKPLGTMPGSIYGAIGLCQFMPSNVPHYGADGNNDGRIDLFEPADAIASLSNYLVRHGWKPNLTREKRHAILKTYNRINIYANTILGLSEAVAVKPAPKAPVKKTKKK